MHLKPGFLEQCLSAPTAACLSVCLSVCRKPQNPNICCSGAIDLTTFVVLQWLQLEPNLDLDFVKAMSKNLRNSKPNATT